MFDLLKCANSSGELKEAVDSLGIVLENKSGNWVAIRYRNSHAAPGWSAAVARDSGGGWFTSPKHFCGRFRSHRIEREKGQEGLAELPAVEESDSLESARARLVEMGFRQVAAPD